MAYYTIEDEDYNANIGVTIKATPTTTNDEFKKEFYITEFFCRCLSLSISTQCNIKSKMRIN